jgi:predicted transcriptional regulator
MGLNIQYAPRARKSQAAWATHLVEFRLDADSRKSYLEGMEVDFTPDLQAKLARIAAERGRDTKALVREAVERFVSYDEWFIRETDKGLAAADRGEFVEHEEVRKIIDRRYPG